MCRKNLWAINFKTRRNTTCSEGPKACRSGNPLNSLHHQRSELLAGRFSQGLAVQKQLSMRVSEIHKVKFMIDPFSIIIGGAAVAWAYSFFAGEEEGEFSEFELNMMVVSSFLFSVAEADGTVHPKELTLIKDLFREHLEENSASHDEARIDYCLAKVKETDQLQHTVIEHSQNDADFRLYLLRTAWRIAAKDGKITDDEVAFIVDAGRVMNATEEEFLLSMLPYVRQTDNDEMQSAARSVLGLKPDSSGQEIKRAYRVGSNKYHPDKFVGENAIVIEMASEKFRQITEAYEVLTSGSTNHQFVRQLDRSGIELASEGSLCRCYFCDQKCKLPPAVHLESARCAKCQCLLAFDKDLAENLHNGANS